MKIKYFKNQEVVDEKEIKEIATEIKKGKIVIFPTETVYGIGTNALDEQACNKIFEIKGREKEKPLIVLISDKNMLNTIAKEINEIEKKLIEKFWPGPLTIVLQKKENIPYIVTAGKEEVSVRMTSGKIAQKLVQEADIPIVAPSANLSGKPTGVNPKDIVKDFEDTADYMIDCGIIESELTSTVVKVIENKIHVIREGKIKKEELEKIAEIET